MTGQDEVTQLKKQLDSTFERANRLEQLGQDTELQSDFARYLCVLVSGYIEKSVVAIVLEHARKNGEPTLYRFVMQKTKRFSNPKAKRIKELLGSFDPAWEREIGEFLDDKPTRDMINSIVNQRNLIAHGESVGITYSRLSAYYQQAQRVIDRVAELCLTTPSSETGRCG